MGMRRAQHISAHKAWKRDVVDIAAEAAHEIGVLLAPDRLADAVFTHPGLTSRCGRATTDAGHDRMEKSL
jgi:hypothetical protein